MNNYHQLFGMPTKHVRSHNRICSIDWSKHNSIRLFVIPKSSSSLAYYGH